MNIILFLMFLMVIIDVINVIGQWLVQDDFFGEVLYQVDCVIFVGNVVMLIIDVVCKIVCDQQIFLLISGGIGYLIIFLYSVIVQYLYYNIICIIGRVEVIILVDIVYQFWYILYEKIWIEDQLINCGENVCFSIVLLNQVVE